MHVIEQRGPGIPGKEFTMAKLEAKRGKTVTTMGYEAERTDTSVFVNDTGTQWWMYHRVFLPCLTGDAGLESNIQRTVSPSPAAIGLEVLQRRTGRCGLLRHHSLIQCRIVHSPDSM